MRRWCKDAAVALLVGSAACSNPAVAKVNGVAIHRREFLARIEAEVRHHPQAAPAQAEQRRQRIARMVLRRMVEAETFKQEAARIGVPMDARTLAAQVTLQRSRFGDDAAYRRWLAATNTTAEEFAQQVQEDYVREQVVERVMPEVTVSPADLARYYEHQREEAQEHARRHDGRDDHDDDDDDRIHPAHGLAEMLPPGADAARAILMTKARTNLRNATYQRLRTGGTVEVVAPYALD